MFVALVMEGSVVGEGEFQFFGRCCFPCADWCCDGCGDCVMRQLICIVVCS